MAKKDKNRPVSIKALDYIYGFFDFLKWIFIMVGVGSIILALFVSPFLFISAACAIFFACMFACGCKAVDALAPIVRAAELYYSTHKEQD